MVSGLVILGAVLLLSAYCHLHNPMMFLRNVVDYQIVSGEWAIWISAVLPLLQVLLGVWLVLGFHLKWASAATSILLSVYLAAQISVMIRGLVIDCGCFGPASSIVGYQTVSIVAACLALAIGGFLVVAREKPLEKEEIT